MEVPLPGCGHTATVPCCEAAKARAGGQLCQQKVQLQMPACGHTVAVECSRRAELLADPTACPAKPCGTALGCGHPCGGKCGDCVRRVLTAGYTELVEGGSRL